MKAKGLLGMVVVAVVFGSFAVTVYAAEKKDRGTASEDRSSVKEEMDALVQLGPGVQNVKKDAKGRVRTLVVVGQSRISTVLGAAKGKEIARKKAAQSARAEFVKWLNDKGEVRESQENETTLFLTGAEENDKEALSEAGKSVEKNGDSFKSVAEGLIRGLTLLHSDVNAEEKTCTVIYGWSAANAKAAKHTATNDPGIEDKPSTSEPKAPSEGRDVSGQKKIRSKKATSKAAAEFLK